LGIETYLEDSQFGLLKTSLAIAGKRFVVDVDVEMDGDAGDEGEGDDIDEATGQGSAAVLGTDSKRGIVSDPSNGHTTGSGLGNGAPDTKMEGRGRIRLAKLTANHVTDTGGGSGGGGGGGSGKSEWIAAVLKNIMEDYIEAWNSDGDTVIPGQKERWERLEEIGARLAQELGDLSWLDARSADGVTHSQPDEMEDAKEPKKIELDWFGSLESEAGIVKSLITA
jgi:hypothetical protein